MERKREYLKTEEIQDMVKLLFAINHLENIIANWLENEMLTSDESKRLKQSTTNLVKVYGTILDSIPAKDKDRIADRIQSSRYLIKDQKLIDIVEASLKRDHKAHMKYVEDMKDLGSELMYYTCKGCSESYKTCIWHDIFDNNIFPESEEGLPNCKYAYTSKYVNEGLRRTTNVMSLKNMRGKKSSGKHVSGGQGPHNKNTSKSSKVKGL